IKSFDEEITNKFFHIISSKNVKYNKDKTEIKFISLLKDFNFETAPSFKYIINLLRLYYDIDIKDISDDIIYSFKDLLELLRLENVEILYNKINKAPYLKNLEDNTTIRLNDRKINTLIVNLTDKYLRNKDYTYDKIVNFILTENISKEWDEILEILENIKTDDKTEFNKFLKCLNTTDDNLIEYKITKWMLG